MIHFLVAKLMYDEMILNKPNGLIGLTFRVTARLVRNE